jgi:sec-independent protein translocase protein TatB
MFDLGWTEMLVIGVVALIVVGPKDLPVLFRRVGEFVGKAKGMAREFSSAMNDAADSSSMKEMSQGINKSLKAATNPIGTAMDGVKSATSSLTESLDPDSETGKLAAQKAADFKKTQASSARSAATRKQDEATKAIERADALEADMKPAARPEAAKATPAKTPAAKKPVAKKAAPKKTVGVAKAVKKPTAPKAKKE